MTHFLQEKGAHAFLEGVERMRGGGDFLHAEGVRQTWEGKGR